MAKPGIGILKIKNTNETKNPISGGGISFFQSNLEEDLFLADLLSLVIKYIPKVHVEIVLVI